MTNPDQDPQREFITRALTQERDEEAHSLVDERETVTEVLNIQNAVLNRFAQHYAAIQILAADNAEARLPKGEVVVYEAELRALEAKLREKSAVAALTIAELRDIDAEIDVITARHGLSPKQIAQN